MSEFVDTPFADLRIPCSHDGRTVLAAIAPLCESMQLDAWTEMRRLATDPDLRELVKTVPDGQRATETATLPIGALALWLDRLADTHADTHLRHRLAILQLEGFPTLLDYWSARAETATQTVDAATVKRQFRRLQSQMSSLSDALKNSATPIEQEILRAQLNQLCQFPVMPRTSASPVLERFWDAIFGRMMNGAELNHARRADRFLALNFRHLADELASAPTPIELTPELRTELKKSRHPYFLGVRVVNSRIARKSLRCWVFNLH
ncbi:phage antirepressor N-terminal domain-containing protein [Bordetella genomosp. 11]|uniref:Uncharacterized protein n=1 Tax=Bordetella genomosp. 11 TaxID=1416808 RepID=A0A261V090_9BORD|nr:phage antirepressor N-terminal domain-containing protein [Bordetella genomosp. 11]OZI66573.1 hypothetical protein CAL28_02235 [Bordetella genomosp. 11]